MSYDLNITFDDNLITGNKTIDTQHKELIERIQNFVTAVSYTHLLVVMKNGKIVQQASGARPKNAILEML